MEKIGLNSFQLKIIALLFMTLDHVNILINTDPFPYYHIFSRFVGVLFGYLLVEGFFHTSSKAKYFARLAIASVIMSVGNTLVANLTGNNAPLGHGMFITLAAGFGIIWLFQWARDQKEMEFGLRAVIFTGGAVLGVIAMMYTEGGFYMIPVIVASYFCHGRKKWLLCIIIVIMSALMAFNSITYTPNDTIDWEMFFAITATGQ